MERFGAITLARIVALAATLVQLPLLTSELRPAQYAIVAAAIASATYVSFASVEPAVLAFQRFPGDNGCRQAYARTQRRLLLAMPVVIVGVLVLGAAFHSMWVFLAAAGWGMGLAWMRLVSAAWLMWDKPWRYSACSSLSTVLRTAALCTLVAVGARPELAVAVAGLLSAAAAVAMRPRVRGVPRHPGEAPRWLGVSLAVYSVAASGLQSIDKVLLPLLTNGHEAGRYAAMSNLSSYSLGALFSVLVATVFAPLLRLWEKDEQGEALRHLRSAMTVALGVTALAASMVLLIGEGPLEALVGDRYLDLPELAALLTATGIFTCGQFTVYLHEFRLTTRALQIRSWLSALITIGLFVLGVRIAGAHGAAAAMVVGSAFFALSLQFRSGTGIWTAAATTALVALGLASISGVSEWLVGACGLVVSLVLLGSMLLRMLHPTRRAVPRIDAVEHRKAPEGVDSVGSSHSTER